jgi:hypothetical protein
MSDFLIEVVGLEKLQAKLDSFPRQIQKYMVSAGKESAKKVLNVIGLKRYPPAGAGNRPPLPYYVRGIGMQYGSYNSGSSEQYGKRWDVKGEGYGVRVGNTASYAKYLAGEKQAKAMAEIGWRKLLAVAKEKLPEIRKIYQAWVDKCIHDLGL